MSHPRRYRDDDPLLARVREICLGLPGAAEKESHGRPNFYTQKVFASYGGTVKGDHGSDRYARSVLVKVDDEGERQGYLADTGRFFLPAYLGGAGWVGYDLTAGEPDWDEVAGLVADSFRATARVGLVRELDARHGA